MKLRLEHLKKTFGHTTALADLSFDVNEGEFVSVIGLSGAGKTTLFRTLNGAIKPDNGKILIDDVNFAACRGKEKRKLQHRIGTIYQDFCLVEQSSCLQNVLNASLYDMNFISAAVGAFGKERRIKASVLLDRVGLADKINEPVKNLSGGQKQRVAIARALMQEPDLLLADEPVASLDPATGMQIIGLLKELQQNDGLTILMNSHNLTVSQEVSDRLIGLRDGRVVFDGEPQQLHEEIISRIYDKC